MFASITAHKFSLRVDDSDHVKKWYGTIHCTILNSCLPHLLHKNFTSWWIFV